MGCPLLVKPVSGTKAQSKISGKFITDFTQFKKRTVDAH